MTARPSPAAIRLVLAIGDGAPPTLAGICRLVAEAGLTGGEWRGYRRTCTVWDDSDGTLAAAGIDLTMGPNGRAGPVCRLTVADGPVRAASHAVPAPGAVPPLAALAAVSRRRLPDAVAAFGRRVTTGRTAALADDAGRLAVELVAQHDRDGERRRRRLVLEAPAGAIAALQALVDRLPLRPTADDLARTDIGTVRIAVTGITAGTTAGDAFLATGRAALRQALGNLDRIAASPDPAPEAIHQFRVAVRRLRAALGLFRDCLDEDARHALAASLREVARLFAEARDLDVFATETLAPLAAAVGEGADLSPASAAVAAARTAARGEIARAVWSPLLARTLLDLVRWFEADEAPLAGEAGRSVMRHARRALRRRRRRLVAHHTAGPASVEEWHALRIEAKKLRYATDAFAALYPPEATRPFVRALQEVQDCLGRYNDAAVADTLAGRLRLDAPATAAIAGWTARERVAQGERFARAWRRLRRRRKFW
ncbi:CHAD domain-containing protein [Stella sp.]|uniref:CHAD domain-containing protein n=1 Tax=Stella sp. TaxID=2912054 RepID=UPI0035B3406E